MTPVTDLRYWSFFFLGLLSLLLFMGGAGLWWRARARARSSRRLPRWGAGAITRSAMTRPGGLNAATVSPRLQQWLERWPASARYERFLQQAGWPLTGAQTLLAGAALVLGLGLLSFLLGLPTGLALLAALGALLTGQAMLAWRRQQRAARLERQLPDALSLVARSMQAGHAFNSALQIAAQESPWPMGSELRAVFNEIQYGESANEALSHWAEQVAGQDVRIFVIAVRIQSETGGNLAELLHQTAALIRERQKLRGTVRVLSAEGRISAVILSLLPFCLAGLLAMLNPGFMAQLWTDPMGIRLLTLALGLMGVGMLWMWQLVRVQP